MLKVLEVALAEAGYLEKASNAQLDDKLANAGDKNFTKYARDLDAIPGFFSGKKQGFAWCSTFVSWCFMKAYGAETAKKMTFQPDRSLAAGVKYAADYYKAAGRYFEIPEAGDQIFFGQKGLYTHTGLVYQVGAKYVYTIEGNTSGASGVIENGGGVCKKTYRRDSDYIFGYGRPNYDLLLGGVVEVTLRTIRQGDSGSIVKTAQALLIKKFRLSCGIYGADGDFGSATVKAVKTFQSLHGLEQDGIIGPQTWTALLL